MDILIVIIYQLIFLFSSLFFIIYIPLKYSYHKFLSIISISIGLISFFLFSRQNLFILTNFLFSINWLFAICTLLFIGIFIGYLIWFVVYVKEFNKAINDCGFLNLVKTSCDIRRYKKQNKQLVDEKNQLRYYGVHAAAIIAIKKRLWRREDDSVYAEGIDLLKNYFKNKLHRPIFFYVCRTPDEAKEIIYNEKVEKIWIFGHGTMYGLYFGKNDFLNYKDLKDAPKKDFIGQFHCCSHPECGFSLDQLILKPNGKKYVKIGYRCTHKNRLTIEKCIENNWTCEEP